MNSQLDREFERAAQEVQNHIRTKTAELAHVNQEIEKTDTEIIMLNKELTEKKKLVETDKNQTLPKLKEKARHLERELEDIHRRQEDALRRHTSEMQHAGMKNIKPL
jgi:hypothetical protein